MSPLTLVSILIARYYLDMPVHLVQIYGCTIAHNGRVQSLFARSHLDAGVVWFIANCRSAGAYRTVFVERIGRVVNGVARYELWLDYD